MNNVTVLIATYKQVPSEAYACTLQLAQTGIPLIIKGGLDLENARYELAKLAIKYGEETLFWLDDDHVFTLEQCHDLWKHFKESKYDALHGMTFARANPSRLLCLKDDKYLDLEEGYGIVDCDVTPFGFLMIKRSVIKRALKDFGTDIFKTAFINKKFESGDTMFYKKLQDKNYKLKVGVDTDIRIKHCGAVV